ncbi:TPR end-of-group domain-containing protein, partial [Mesonia mobilis]
MKKIVLLLFISILIHQLSAQEKIDPFRIKKEADRNYQSKDYALATKNYIQFIEVADFKVQKKSAAYNAACCLALQESIDSAFVMLDKAIDFGLVDKSHLLSDSDLEILHQDQRWEKLISGLSESDTFNTDPELAN